MHVLVTCKNEDDSIKNEGARVVRTLMVFLTTCKNQEDPIKNEGAVLRILGTFSLL